MTGEPAAGPGYAEASAGDVLSVHYRWSARTGDRPGGLFPGLMAVSRSIPASSIPAQDDGRCLSAADGSCHREPAPASMWCRASARSGASCSCRPCRSPRHWLENSLQRSGARWLQPAGLGPGTCRHDRPFQCKIRFAKLIVLYSSWPTAHALPDEVAATLVRPGTTADDHVSSDPMLLRVAIRHQPRRLARRAG
jgi:hypothetical protein